MTQPPLDVAALMAKLKQAAATAHHTDPGFPCVKCGVNAAIDLLEPHAPQPPDLWLQGLHRKLAMYGNTRAEGDHVRLSSDRQFSEILDYVAAVLARTRGERPVLAPNVKWTDDRTRGRDA